MAVAKNKRVPIAAFQTTAKTRRGIMDKKRICHDKAKKAPTKVPIPLPPANFKNTDQLLPITANKPEKICNSEESPIF